ncbi:MAG TPA: helix-turn-helix transcriptional regulator [Terriglobales bacterium]|nr:helix-turn-helix transcriptional regulator [Terriglobales bacterium]
MQIDYPGMHVLALLHERPRHPYDMVRELRARHLDRSSRLGGLPRSLYHAVDRLAERNLIEPTETTREGNRPERTVYRITDEGRDEFDVGLRQLLETPTSEHPALAAGLGFAVYLTPGTVLDALEGRIVALTSEVAQLDAGLRALQEQVRLPRIILIGVECRRALRQAELEWARSLADELRTGTLAWDWDSIAGHFAAEQARREALGRMS